MKEEVAKLSENEIIVNKKDIEYLIIKLFLFVGGGALLGAVVAQNGGGVFPSMLLPMMGLIIALKPWIGNIREEE